MFDVSWSELLILGLVTLIFVGPKELPRFLGTLGKYAGVVRRQANEFRSVFEQAMREAEMDQIQKEMRDVRDGVKASLDEATRSVDAVKSAARVDSGTPAAASKPVSAPEGERSIAPPSSSQETVPAADQPEADVKSSPEKPASETTAGQA